MSHILHLLYHHRLLNAAVVITVAIGLMFPIAVLSTVSFMLDNLRLCSYDDPQNRIVADCRSVYQQPERLDEWLDTDQTAEYGYIAYTGVLRITDQGVETIGVAGTTERYLELEGFALEDGRMITKEEYEQGAHVCMLRDDCGVSVGEVISLMGEDYEVVGRINVPKMYGVAAVPYRCMEELAAGDRMQFRISFRMEGPEAAIRFPMSCLDFADEVLSFAWGEEINEPYVGSIRAQAADMLRKGGIVIFAALISILFILTGKVCEERYLIGLRIGMGATGMRIYWELLIENGILMACALLLDLLLFPIVIRNMRTVYGYPSPWMLACIAGVLLVITAVVSGVVYLRAVRRMSPAELLKGEA
ncbi:MAG: ABC transporter permease [Clostridium sp.]|nr:ABC transporter permease [Clostridium sp.]